MRSILATLLLLLLSSFAAAQKQPKTVTDFYLALPGTVNGIEGTQDLKKAGFEDDFFFYSNERNESKTAIEKYRRSLIKVADIKNGYLRLESVELEGWIEMALFKKLDGTYVVALSQVGCGPGCDGAVMFMTYKKGTWTNVTNEVFPADPAPNGYYQLPRTGTTIELNGGEDCGDDKECEARQKLAEFVWNRSKFVRK